jgi:hypothetical protein
MIATRTVITTIASPFARWAADAGAGPRNGGRSFPYPTAIRMTW